MTKWILILYLFGEPPVHHGVFYDMKQCMFIGMHMQTVNSDEVRKFDCVKVKEL